MHIEPFTHIETQTQVTQYLNVHSHHNPIEFEKLH